MIRSAAVHRGIPRFGDTEISPMQGLMRNPLLKEMDTIFLLGKNEDPLRHGWEDGLWTL